MSPLAGVFPIAYKSQIDLYTEQKEFHMLQNEAPTGHACAYDRMHLAIYAAMLDAEAVGLGWREGAKMVLHLDPERNADVARTCWESHLERARWIVGEGLASAVVAFNTQAVASSAS